MFMCFIPLTVNLIKNSKLEKFVHELNALWKLSGSSMGALRELVAVAGIGSVINDMIIVSKSKTDMVACPPNVRFMSISQG